MKNLNIYILAAFCSILFTNKINAQASNAKMESVFMYNFTKLVNWPVAYRSGNFVIGVLGNSPIVNELKNMAKTKKAGSQNIEIVTFGSVGAITKCHIIFVPKGQAGNIPSVASKVSSFSTLIVSEAPGAIDKGAAINFVIIDNKQKFELRESNATKYGLTIGAQLRNLGIPK